MPISCIRYTDGKEQEWDEFVATSNRNATFLHSRRFFRHNPLNATDDASLLFYKKNKLCAVLPASLYNRGEKTYFHSHPRSTYGGFVINASVGVEDAVEMVAQTISFAADNHVNELIVRNPFRIFHALPSDETDYAMWYHGFTLKAREIESAILLNEDTRNQYAGSTARSLRKALRHVQVDFTTDYEAYWQLLTKNLAEKHQVKPVHSFEQFSELLRLVGGDCIRLVTARCEEKIIAGIVLFVTPRALHAQYIASDSAFQELRALNAVIDFIIDWGIRNNFHYFNLGSGNEEAGRKINTGLFAFKEGFGGRGILRETMSLVLK